MYKMIQKNICQAYGPLMAIKHSGPKKTSEPEGP